MRSAPLLEEGPRRLRRAGLAFALALLVLAVALVANLTVLGLHTRSGYDYGGFELGDERAVFARSVVATPGDRLVLRAELGALGPGAFASYDLYVVPGGGREALLAGRMPETVHVRVSDMSPLACCANGRVVIDVPGTPRDVDRSPLAHPELGSPNRLDLVWVFQYAEGFAPPANETERRVLAERLETQLAAHGGAPAPTVVGYDAVRAQPFFHALKVLAALGAAAGAVLWVARLVAAGPAAEAEGTEALLDLHRSAGVHLAGVRDLLVGGAVTVSFVALHVFVAGQPGGALGQAQFAQLAPAGDRAVRVALVVLYCAIAAAWLFAIAHVQRALARWRRRAAIPPLDL